MGPMSPDRPGTPGYDVPGRILEAVTHTRDHEEGWNASVWNASPA